MFANAANNLLRSLLAPACASCRSRLDRPLDGPICRACWIALPRLSPPWCDWCGDALPPQPHLIPLCHRCLQAPPNFEIARSAGRYEGALRDLIHAFKYEGRRVLAPPLARFLSHAGTDLLADASAVVPVPLHPWRALRRGFNQADDLAQHLGLPVWRVLRRTRLGSVQAGLDATARGPNVQDAFGPSHSLLLVPGHRARRLLKGSTVVLIDDVMTTGATIDACSRVLVEAGVRTVRALTVARTVARPPRSPHRPHRPLTAPHR
jgi:ComF family protein